VRNGSVVSSGRYADSEVAPRALRSGGADDAPPVDVLIAPVLHLVRRFDYVLTSEAGQHHVADAPWLRHELEHAPQAAGVVLRSVLAIPLVDASIGLVVVVCHP